MSGKTAFLTLSIAALSLGWFMSASAQTSPDYPTGGTKVPDGATGGGRARQAGDGTPYINPFTFSSSFRFEAIGSPLIASFIAGRVTTGNQYFPVRRRTLR